MAMRSTSSLCEFDDLIGRFAQRQNRIARKTFPAQFPLSFFQISAVLLHLLAFGKFQLIKISGYPSIGDVDEKQLRPGHAGERLDVAENRFIGGECSPAESEYVDTWRRGLLRGRGQMEKPVNCFEH